LRTQLAACGVLAAAGEAQALSLAVAKKCHALTMQEYPRPKDHAAYKPGNPGTARLREAHYRDCVAKETAAQPAAPAARR
jgi:hypothetical protein